MNKTLDMNNLYNLEYLPSININTYPFFREFEMKANIRDHAHNYTKSYQIKKTWQFQPDQSSNLKGQLILKCLFGTIVSTQKNQ